MWHLSSSAEDLFPAVSGMMCALRLKAVTFSNNQLQTHFKLCVICSNELECSPHPVLSYNASCAVTQETSHSYEEQGKNSSLLDANLLCHVLFVQSSIKLPCECLQCPARWREWVGLTFRSRNTICSYPWLYSCMSK